MRRTKPKPRKPTKPIKPGPEPYFIVPRQEAPGCPIAKLYHRTNRVAARRIMRHGFKDSTNYYMAQPMDTGVWLSSVPLYFHVGPSGDVLLQVDTNLAESDLAQYEWIEKGRGYREWLVPAAVVNPSMRVTVVRHS